jgi:hypothetical protein
MWSNHRALKMKNILTMYTSSIRCFMGLRNHLEHHMNVLGIFSLKMILRLIKPVLLFSLERLIKIYSFAKIYVDDIIFGSTKQSFCDEFSKIMTDRFDMSMMEELRFFLGFQIKQLDDGTFISQIKYTHDSLKKFDMDKAKSIKTLMGTNGYLDLDMGGTLVDQRIYHSIIGPLLYLCASRPDIMLSACMCAIFQAVPKECHLRVVKRIMISLVLTPNLGLWYPKGSHFDLIG